MCIWKCCRPSSSRRGTCPRSANNGFCSTKGAVLSLRLRLADRPAPRSPKNSPPAQVALGRLDGPWSAVLKRRASPWHPLRRSKSRGTIDGSHAIIVSERPSTRVISSPLLILPIFSILILPRPLFNSVLFEISSQFAPCPSPFWSPKPRKMICFPSAWLDSLQDAWIIVDIAQLQKWNIPQATAKMQYILTTVLQRI